MKSDGSFIFFVIFVAKINRNESVTTNVCPALVTFTQSGQEVSCQTLLVTAIPTDDPFLFLY